MRKIETNSPLQVGQTVVVFVPPGWILAGTISAQVKGGFLFDEVYYIEEVHAGYSSIGQLAEAQTPKQQQKVIKSCYALPDGTYMRGETLLLAVPAPIPM